MVSIVRAVDGQPYFAANYNVMAETVEKDDALLLVLARRNLGEAHAAGPITNNNSPATTLVSLPVTIPSGLPAGTRIKVTGTIGQASTPTGVGMTVDITNATSAGAAVQTGSAMSGGTSVIRYDDNPPAGSRIYTMTMLTTVGGQTVTARAVQLQAEIC